MGKAREFQKTFNSVSLTILRPLTTWLTISYRKFLNRGATHSSVLAWRIPGMVEPGGLLSLGSHRVGQIPTFVVDDAVKVLHLICQKIWKTQQWPQDWKSQFSFLSQRKAMPKNAQTTAQLHSSHMLVK